MNEFILGETMANELIDGGGPCRRCGGSGRDPEKLEGGGHPACRQCLGTRLELTSLGTEVGRLVIEVLKLHKPKTGRPKKGKE